MLGKIRPHKGIILCLLVFLSAVFLFSVNSVKADDIVALNNPILACEDSGKVTITLSWSSNISGGANYSLLKKNVTDSSFSVVKTDNFNSYIDTVDSDKSFNYQVRYERSGSPVLSEIKTATALHCPAKIKTPVEFSCQNNKPVANLSWSSVSGSSAGYDLYRKIVSAGVYDLTGSFGSSVFNYQDITALAGNKVYNYYLTSKWSDGISSSSGAVSFTAPACSPLLQSNTVCLDDTEPGGPAVDLTWTRMLGVGSYQVYRKVLGGTYSLIYETANEASSSYRDALAPNSFPSYDSGGQLSYKIKTLWGGDVFVDSNEIQVDIPRCRPFIKVQSICDQINFKVNLFWSKTKGATNYNVYRQIGSNPMEYFAQATSSPSATLELNTSICPNKKCTISYQVRPTLSDGSSIDWMSHVVTKEIDCSPRVPSPAPVLLSGIGYCDTSQTPARSVVMIEWSGSDDISYYSVYRNGVERKTLDRFVYDTGVSGGSEYTYTVTAFGQGGLNVVSPNAITVKAPNCTPPSDVILNSPGAVCEYGKPKVNLSWLGGDRAVSYDVYRGSSASNLTYLTNFNDLSTNSWSDSSNLISSTGYYYKIIANGPTGTGTATSNTVNITTPNCLPATPTGLSLTPLCGNAMSSVRVSWTANDFNTDHYEVFRRKSGTTDWSLAVYKTLNNSTGTWTDIGAVDFKQAYDYKIEAVGYGGDRKLATASVTTYDCSNPGTFILNNPGASTCIGSYPKIYLTWQDSSKFDHYNLYSKRFNSTGGLVETELSPYVGNSGYDYRGFGKALSFKRSSAQLASLSNSDSRNMDFSNGFSLETWFRVSGVDQNDLVNNPQPLINKFTWGCSDNNGNSFDYCGFNVGVYGGVASFSFRTDVSNNTVSGDSYGVLKINKWYQLTTVWDKTNVKLYINGQLVGTKVATGNPLISNGSWLLGDSGNSSWFNGLIDETRVYKRALSSSEVSDHYNGTFSDNSGLVAWWRMDENGGQKAYDSSNNKNDLSLGWSTDSVDGRDPTWVAHGLQYDQDHKMQVEAVGTFGSTFSNETDKVLVTNYCPLPKPGIFLINLCKATGTPKVSINFSHAYKASSYEIYRGSTKIYTTPVGSSDPSQAGFGIYDDMTSLATSTSYSYKVRAIFGSLYTDSDIIATTTLTCQPPIKPVVASSTSCVGLGGIYPRVNLNWGHTSASMADYYAVYRKDGFITDSYIGSVYNNENIIPTSTPQSVVFYDNFRSNDNTSIMVNTQYSYTVKAMGKVGANGIDSLPIPIKVGYCNTSIASTSVATDCDSDSNTIVNVSWVDNAPFNTKQYSIYRNNQLLNTIDNVKSTSTDAVNQLYTDKAVSGGSVYQYYIKAIGFDASSTQTQTSVATTTAKICGYMPVTPTLSLNGSCQDNLPNIRATWATTTNAITYKLYRHDDDNKDYLYSSAYVDNTALAPGGGSYDNAYVLGFYGDRSAILDNTKLSVALKSALRASSAFSLYFRINSHISSGNNNYGATKEVIRITDTNNISNIVYYDINNGTERICIVGKNAAYYCSGSDMDAKDGQWFDVVLTYSAGTLKFFIDGLPVATSTGVSTNLSRSTISKVLIGSGFWGELDDIRFYNRVLTNTEVANVSSLRSNSLANSNLIARWSFDEGNGQDIGDASGNGNIGYLGGSSKTSFGLDDPAWIRYYPSKPTNYFEDLGAYSAKFGGNYSYNYVYLKSNSSISPKKSITWEAWFNNDNIINPSQWAGYLAIFRNYNNKMMFNKDSDSFNISFEYKKTDGTTDVAGCWGVPLERQKWFHMVATYGLNSSNTNSEVNVYINGVLKKTCPISGIFDLQDNTDDLYFGTYGGSDDMNYKGQIDNFRIYGRALKSAEVAEHYSGVYKNESELRLAWDFDENDKVYVHDRSGNGNHGLLGKPSSYNLLDKVYNNDITSSVGNNLLNIPRPRNGHVYTYKLSAINANLETPTSDVVYPATNCVQKPDLTLNNICYNYSPATILSWGKYKNISSYTLYKDGVVSSSAFGGASTKAPQDFMTEDGYIKHWLVAGPFSANGVEYDYVDEANTSPRAGASSIATWVDHYSSGKTIDFSGVLGYKTSSVAYAFAYVYVPTDQVAQLRLTNDDGVDIFLNGNKIYTRATSRTTEYLATTTILSAGLNKVLVKTKQVDGDWRFTLRFTKIYRNSIVNALDNITVWDSNVSDQADNSYKVSASLDGSTNDSVELTASSTSCVMPKITLTSSRRCSSSVPSISYVDLSWRGDLNSSVTAWNVWSRKSTTTDPWKIVGTIINPSVSATANIYSDSSGETGSDYDYYVEGIGKGVIFTSDATTETFDFCSSPAVVPTVTLTPGCAGNSSKVLVGWVQLDINGNSDTTNTISYSIFRNGDPLVSGLPLGTNAYSDDVNLLPKEIYTYKVSAINQTDNKFTSKGVSTTTIDCLTIPPLPTTIVYSDVRAKGATSTVKLTWNHVNATEYRIYRKVGSAPSNSDIIQTIKVADLDPVVIDAGIITYIDGTTDGTFDGAKYTYVIKAFNNYTTTGTLSNQLDVTVPVAVPDDFVLQGESKNKGVDLSWTTAISSLAGGTVSYKVQKSADAAFTSPVDVKSTRSDCTNLSTLVCLDRRPQKAMRFYRVIATNSGGETISNVIELDVKLGIPIWREISPIFESTTGSNQ